MTLYAMLIVGCIAALAVMGLLAMVIRWLVVRSDERAGLRQIAQMDADTARLVAEFEAEEQRVVDELEREAYMTPEDRLDRQIADLYEACTTKRSGCVCGACTKRRTIMAQATLRAL